ncbi:hypothetical protein [Myxococcus sp. Y35]|uniref:hypothetical protein n=1 Tax=Pseudomyxococcus flavus TaxID=3115648 RepID=UPI003CE7066A
MTTPPLSVIEEQLRGHPLFRAQVQGSGLALFADKPTTRTAYMLEAVARGAHERGGPAEVIRLALHALGWDAPPTEGAGAGQPMKVGDLHIDVTCDTGPAIASLEALESTLERIGPKLERPSVTMSEVSGAIAACAGALNALGEAGTRVPGEHQEKAAAHLVALVERAKQLACGAE